jgi:hypothetical protein
MTGGFPICAREHTIWSGKPSLTLLVAQGFYRI